jgi:hypothetical protein
MQSLVVERQKQQRGEQLLPLAVVCQGAAVAAVDKSAGAMT